MMGKRQDNDGKKAEQSTHRFVQEAQGQTRSPDSSKKKQIEGHMINNDRSKGH